MFIPCFTPLKLPLKRMRIWADETDRAESAAFENGGSLQSLNLVKSGYFLTRSAFVLCFFRFVKRGTRRKLSSR
jgi:hypothetical protein